MNSSISRGLAGLAVLATVPAGTGRAGAQPTNIELIIDDSGSMAQRVVGGRKIDVAKKVFSGVAQDLPSDSQIAVRTYGRQRPSRDHDCADMEIDDPVWT
jgi:Ca-activated chloride channel homolog